MQIKTISICLLLLVSATSLGSAQLSQPQQRPFPNQVNGNPYPASRRSVDNAPTQSPTTQQRLDFQQRQRERQQLAQQRQREMEQRGQSKTLYPRLVGEFEPQQAILLSVGDWKPHHFPILKEIVAKSEGHARLVVLYNQPSQLREAVNVLSEGGTRYSHVDFLSLELDTIWLRDFGPRFAENENGKAMSIDFYYEGSRPKDDDMPETWARLSTAEYNHVPWTLQGGNLLANGKGLAIASDRIFGDNQVQFPPTPGQDPVVEQRNFVVRQFKLFCNIKELVLLQPLESEATKHVDMFATILAPDLVLVAQVDGRYDPRNAQILDANAKRLSQLDVDGKPMRVERIFVPPRREKYWSPYTNIILTDKLVLMPTFNTDPPEYVQRAIETYQRLLPNHHVATIDMSSMSRLEGSLHCLSCNVPEFAKMPEGLISFEEALAMRDQPAVSNPQTAAEPRRSDSVGGSAVARKSAYETQIRQAKNAVETYRRNFQIEASRKQVDGYAVAADDQALLLMRASDKSLVELNLGTLAKADLDWVTHHRDQINRNGEQIKKFLTQFVK